MPKEIKLVLHGEAIVPEDSPDTASGVTKVRHGDPVTFTLGAQFKEASITFTKGSPLDDGAMTVLYNTPLVVSKSAPAGSYPYDCTAKDQNDHPRHSIGGGDMVIIAGN